MSISPVMQLVLSSVIFGLGAVFVVFIDLSAILIAFYRLLVGTLVFALVLAYKRQRFSISASAGIYAALAGAFFAIDLALWNASILSIGPGIATILNSLQVFFMALFAVILYKEQLTKYFFFSLCVTFFGVVLLSADEINGQSAGLYGITVGILSGFAFAISMLCLRIAVQKSKNHLIKVMFYASVSGTLTAAIMAVVAGHRFVINDTQTIVMMLFYALAVHVIAWFLMAKSIPSIRVALVGLIFCLEPVIAFFIDLSFLEKSVTIYQFIGAVITLFAVYLGTQINKTT